MAMGTILGDYIEKWHVKKTDWIGEEKLEVLGVSNISGVTTTSSVKSKDLSGYLVIEPDTLVYNPYRINVGSVGLTPKNVFGIVSPAYVVFKVREGKLIPELLLDFLKSFDGLQQINKYARGTVRKALRFDDLCKIEVNFPSYSEQKNIFDKKLLVEQKNDELVNEIKFQKQLLTQLKQAVIQEKIQVKYTKDLNFQNSNSESISKLLEYIKETKTQLILDKKIKKEIPFPPVLNDEIPSIFKDVKCWVRLNDICYVEKGNIGITKAIQGDYPLVVTGKNRSSHNDFQFDCKAVIVPLVSSTGHGHASLKRIHYQENKFAVGTILACIHPYSENIINMKFLFKYLDIFKEMFFVNKMKGAANVTLKIKSIKETPIPVIPYNIQCNFEEIMQEFDFLKKEIEITEANTKILMQAILKEAFEDKKEEVII